MSVWYSIGFSVEEKEELLALVSSSPKWVERIKGAFGSIITAGDVQPTIGYYAINTTGVKSQGLLVDDSSWIGKRVMVVRGDYEVSQPVCLDKTGTITGWYHFEDKGPANGYSVILPASRYHTAIVSGDNGETFHANTSWCDKIL